jgi:hypothetical protein
MHPLANFLLFQAGWFASVLGASYGYPWVGPLVVAVVLLAHLVAAVRPGREARLLAVALLVGLVVDSLFVAGGWLQYANGQWQPWLAPYWIVAMWPLFATTLNVSMRWLHGRTLVAVVLGATAGPASYLGGAALGAVTLAPGAMPLVVIGIAWALAFPGLLRLARHFDGTRTGPLPGQVTNWIASP